MLEDDEAAQEQEQEAAGQEAPEQEAAGEVSEEAGEQEPQGEDNPEHPRHGINDIVAKVRAQRGAGAEEADEQQDEEPAPATPTEEQSEQQASSEEREQPQETPDDGPDLEQEIEMVVNGQAVKKKLKDIVTDAQKVGSAQQLYEEAAQMRAAAAAPQEQEPAPASTPEPSQEGKPDEAVADLVNAIRYGSEDEAVEAAQKLFAEGTAGQADEADVPDPGQMVEAVTHRVFAKTAVDEAGEHFGENYQDIAQDPDLMYVTARRIMHGRYTDLAKIGVPAEELNQMTPESLSERHLMEQMKGTVRSEKALYVEVADGIRDWRGGETPATPTEPVRESAEKLKADTPQPPAPASQKAQPGTPAPAPKTRSQVISEMAASRHQA